jgi:predicted RNA-binding Zn-ribbon protein involved in translation (DUF1610 family)
MMDSHSSDSQQVMSSERVLTAHAIRVCKKYGINYIELPLMSRKLITHYCCDKCKFQSLSNIDFRSSNKPRCRLCGMRVHLGRSKFTKLRRKVILSLHQSA